LASLQRREGPNIVGFYGLFQPLSDGFKLLLKESILPKSSNVFIFCLAPIFSFGLSLAGWIILPIFEGAVVSDLRLGVLYLFAISSLGVHAIIMAGWSSNSKYAFLGGVRSAAQMISYEIPMSVTILSLIVISGSLNFLNVIQNQNFIWYIFPLFPTFLLFFISILAETNRHPFDLPEAESELVSGYNVEYSSMGFALFFLAEYSNIILFSSITALFFLGGGNFFFLSSLLFLKAVFFSLKAMFFVTLFILVRGTLPRVRYDQLIRLGWKVLLPLSLGFLIFYSSLLLSFNSIHQFIW
jgi:NADH:ubiquinone oxidoreductase subunit H